MEAFTRCYENLERCPFEHMLAGLASKNIISFDLMHELQSARGKTDTEKRQIVLNEVYRHLYAGNTEAYEQLKAVLKNSKTYAFHAKNLEAHETEYRAPVVKLPPAVNTRPREQTPAESPEMRALTIEFERLVGAMNATAVCTQLVGSGLVRLGDEMERIERKGTNADRNKALLDHIRKHIQAGRPQAIEHFIFALSNARTSTGYLGGWLAKTLKKCREEEQEKRQVQQAPPVRVVPASGAVKRREVDSLSLEALSVNSSSPVAVPAVEKKQRSQTKAFNLQKYNEWLGQPMTPDDIKRLAPLFSENQWKHTALLLDLPYVKYERGIDNPCEQMLLAYLNTGQPSMATTNHMQDRAAFMNFLNTVEVDLYFKVAEEFREWSQEDTIAPTPQSPQAAPSVSSELFSASQLSSHRKDAVNSARKEGEEFDFVDAYGHHFIGCTICRSPFLVNDDVSVLGCLHQFHPECLNLFESQTVTDKVCPVCRYPSIKPLKRQ
ncbi:RING finger domain-containing protein [Parendozoicomonas sp. Alg238-R29]|uniref:RING finger domain-containing protein n=1 Tax=Parendozoicomonas sp. Alg238-R29 TaxID=2993446 RepID=UPI00248E4897|nr:RING finger domain-containing protein [Parendozoicomonas sp. Alg238-R29]